MPITASQALFLGSVSATALLSIGSEAPTRDPNLCSGPSNLTFPTSRFLQVPLSVAQYLMRDGKWKPALHEEVHPDCVLYPITSLNCPVKNVK